MNSATYTNEISQLSYEIKENDEKATIQITLDIKFPFKYLTNKLALQLMEYYFEIGKFYKEYKNTPYLEIANLLLNLKKNDIKKEEKK